MICYDGVVHLTDFGSILPFDRDRNFPFVVTCFIGFATLMICWLREEIIEKESIFNDLFAMMGNGGRPSELECRSRMAMRAQHRAKLEEIVLPIKREPSNDLTNRYINHDDDIVLRRFSSLRVCCRALEFFNAPDNQWICPCERSL
jgi:hypothetical protein